MSQLRPKSFIAKSPRGLMPEPTQRSPKRPLDSLVHEVRKWGFNSLSQDKLLKIDSLLNVDQKSSHLKILRIKDNAPKRKRVLNPLKEHERCLLKFDHMYETFNGQSSELNDFLQLRENLCELVSKRDIMGMLHLYQTYQKVSNSKKLKLICCMDQIIILQFLGVAKEYVRTMIRLSDQLVALKYYQYSLTLLEVALAHALNNRLTELELMIYDKLGLTLYYLQRLEQSLAFHNYFSEGKSRADIEGTWITKHNHQYILFSDRFYQAISVPLLNDTSMMPHLDQVLNEFMARPELRSNYSHSLLFSVHRLKRVGIKSHLSGLRQRFTHHKKQK